MVNPCGNGAELRLQIPSGSLASGGETTGPHGRHYRGRDVIKKAGLIGGLSGPVLAGAMAFGAAAESLNLYGNAGLIEMPVARPMPDGTVSTTIAGFDGVERVTVDFQLAPRVGASFRYATLSGFDGPNTERTDQQLDLKFVLARETETLPALALGIRDLIGSGANAGEYLVASKTVAPGLTLTGGLGWGRLGSDRAFDNPIGGTRSQATGGADRFNLDLFQGDGVGVFGGLEWRAPRGGWVIKAEYSSDAYATEAAHGARDIASPWNFGIEKQLFKGLDAGIYYLNGSDIGFRLSFTADPNRANAPQDFLPGPAPLKARAMPVDRSTGWAAAPGIQAKVFDALGKALAPEGIIVDGGAITGTHIDIAIINRKMNRMPKAIGRTARVLALALPPSVETFDITLIEDRIPTTTVAVNRSDLERLDTTFAAVPESWRLFARSNALPLPEAAWQRAAYPAFSYALAPRVPFGLAGDGLSFDVILDASATYRVSRSLSFSGTVTQSLLGGFEDTTTAAGPLPQVRSNFAEFQSNGPQVERLTGEYVTKLAPHLYARASFGMLERMYGGISSELLWKDTTSPFAYGIELNYAKQRDPDALLGFGDYETWSGHGSLYWESARNGISAQLDAGRYLAGDWGATVTLGRRFSNGWEVAGYVTKTDADTSASDGAFDKGIRLTIPLQWTTPFATRRAVTVPFSDFTRDDGARLNIGNRLYPILRDSDEKRLGDNWEAFWQ